MFRLIAVSEIEQSGYKLSLDQHRILLNFVIQKNRIFSAQKKIIDELDKGHIEKKS